MAGRFRKWKVPQPDSIRRLFRPGCNPCRRRLFYDCIKLLQCTGLLILHSKDLVNWKVVNYALDELPEFRYRNPIHGCGVWAPAIRYHEGTYYICFPMPDEGIYMTTTKDPFGKWSKPVNIRPGAGWIDPCPFWDDDGKAYLVAGVARAVSDTRVYCIW